MASAAKVIPTKSASVVQGKAIATGRIPDPSPGEGKYRSKNRRRKKALQRKKLAQARQAEKDKGGVAGGVAGIEGDGWDVDEEMWGEDGGEDKESDGSRSETGSETGSGSGSHDKRNVKNKDAKNRLQKEWKKVKRKEAKRGGLVRITAREDDEGGGVWYYHLRMITHPTPPPPQSTPPDLLTWRTFLTSSLTRLFGIQGASCLVDILKLDNWDCWVKVVGSDGDFGAGISRGGFGVAVGGYVGALAGDEAGSGREVSVRVVRGGRWLIGVAGGGERDLWAA